MTAPVLVTQRVVGWLEEAPGVKSSTRLFAAILLVYTGILLVTIIGYVWFCVTRTPPIPLNGAVITGFAACLTAIVGQGAVAIMKRNTGEDDK